MAKKNYTQIKITWDAKVESIEADKSIISFEGKNSAGTEVKVSVTIEDYFFVYLIKDMVRIAKRRVSKACERLDDIKEMINN